MKSIENSLENMQTDAMVLSTKAPFIHLVYYWQLTYILSYRVSMVKIESLSTHIIFVLTGEGKSFW